MWELRRHHLNRKEDKSHSLFVSEALQLLLDSNLLNFLYYSIYSTWWVKVYLYLSFSMFHVNMDPYRALWWARELTSGKAHSIFLNLRNHGNLELTYYRQTYLKLHIQCLENLSREGFPAFNPFKIFS